MDLLKDLTCPVCLELFNHPVILPCSHVLCQRPCAETICEASSIRCPVCRENCGIKGGVRNLPRVITIENIIDKVKAWPKVTEDSQTKAATSLAPKLTNDSGLSEICENINTCLPIISLNYSSTSSFNVSSIKEVRLKSIDQNIHSCQGCTDETIHSPAPEVKIANNNEVYGISDCSSSEMKIITLTSCVMSATDHRQLCGRHACRSDQARSELVEGQLEKQVQEQLRKLSEAKRQLLDTVTLYRKCTHVVEGHGMALKQTAPMLLNRIRSTQLTNQRAEQRDNTCLTIPSQPIIDLHRSSRSNNLVALVICPPPSCDEINSYEITYFSEEEMHRNMRKNHNVKWPINSRPMLKKVTFVLVEGLSDSTNYYFSACAVNRAGRSPVSDLVNCRTLSQRHCVVPVPAIMKNLCRASVTSATILCPSPRWVTRSQGVSHFILHRQDGGDFVWRGEQIREVEEHQVERLEPGTDYQFVVLARNLSGECQISEKITLTTCSER